MSGTNELIPFDDQVFNRIVSQNSVYNPSPEELSSSLQNGANIGTNINRAASQETSKSSANNSQNNSQKNTNVDNKTDQIPNDQSCKSNLKPVMVTLTDKTAKEIAMVPVDSDYLKGIYQISSTKTLYDMFIFFIMFIFCLVIAPLVYKKYILDLAEIYSTIIANCTDNNIIHEAVKNIVGVDDAKKKYKLFKFDLIRHGVNIILFLLLISIAITLTTDGVNRNQGVVVILGIYIFIFSLMCIIVIILTSNSIMEEVLMKPFGSIKQAFEFLSTCVDKWVPLTGIIATFIITIIYYALSYSGVIKKKNMVFSIEAVFLTGFFMSFILAIFFMNKNEQNMKIKCKGKD